MSAENDKPSGPADGAPDDAADASHAPASARGAVVASHGEREKRAYVAPVQVPRRHQRLHTIDMSKVRISPDMKVQQLDPRHMPTQKMDLPPGGIRPLPPPANAEISDPSAPSRPSPGVTPPPPPLQPGASPWSQNAGIDRSMLPSAAIAAPPNPQAQRIPSMPPPRSQASPAGGIGIGVWIAVILVAALLGGGIALALRSGGSSGSTDPAASSVPIAVPVPTTTNTATTDDSEVVDPNSTESAAGTSATTKTTTPKTVPRKTSPAPKSTTPAPAPAPTTKSPRLFN